MKLEQRRFSSLVAFATALMLTACAGESESETPWIELYGADLAQDFKNFAEDAPMSAAQEAELIDGTVTEAELNAAFERYRACLREDGYEVFGIQRDGPFLTFSIPAPAVESGAYDTCYAKEYAGVDGVWQIVENADAGERRAFLSECVMQLNVTFTGASSPATMEDMERAITEAGYTLDECPNTP